MPDISSIASATPDKEPVGHKIHSYLVRGEHCFKPVAVMGFVVIAMATGVVSDGEACQASERRRAPAIARAGHVCARWSIALVPMETVNKSPLNVTCYMPLNVTCYMPLNVTC